MAIGQGQGGGLFALPDMPALGPTTWAQMSGLEPDNPLVGGRGPAGGVDPDHHYRRVAVATPDAMPIGQRQHFSELLNFSHSPMPWILFAALAYLGFVALHVSGRAGPFSASAGVGKGK
jgi:hypothetical protein